MDRFFGCIILCNCNKKLSSQQTTNFLQQQEALVEKGTFSWKRQTSHHLPVAFFVFSIMIIIIPYHPWQQHSFVFCAFLLSLQFHNSMAFTLGEPGSVWQQFSSFFFLTAGLFNDLLCVRTCLTMSYVFLVIAGFMGAPRWSHSFQPTGIISVDTIVWACLNLVVHASSVYNMFYDERNIVLKEDEETLWRFIFRHSGLSKLLFQKKLCPHFKVVEYEKGSHIPCKNHFYILLDGVVSAQAFNGNTGKKHTFPMLSGQMFPLQHIYACTQSKSIEAMSTDHTFANTWVATTAATHVKLYQFDADFLHRLSSNCNAKETWLAFLTSAMAEVAITPYYDDTDVSAFCSEKANQHLVHQRSPLFDKLMCHEEPDRLSAGSTKALQRPLLHLLNSYRLSFWMPWPLGIWPAGLRHRLPPPQDPDVRETIKCKSQMLRLSIVKALDVGGYFDWKEFDSIYINDGNGDDKANSLSVPYGTFPLVLAETARTGSEPTARNQRDQSGRESAGRAIYNNIDNNI